MEHSFQKGVTLDKDHLVCWKFHSITAFQSYLSLNAPIVDDDTAFLCTCRMSLILY